MSESRPATVCWIWDDGQRLAHITYGRKYATVTTLERSWKIGVNDKDVFRSLGMKPCRIETETAFPALLAARKETR